MSSTPDPAPSSRERIRRALLRPNRAQFVVAVLLAALGFAFMVQVKDYQREDAYAGLREADLIEVLDSLTGTSERARREIERLEATKEDLQSESRAREAALGEARQRAETLNILAGLVPVKGPGLRITITEDEGRAAVGSLLDLVQELRTAGAEAIEFNDTYRLVAQSSFDAGIGGIELEGNLLEAPYVVEVIGDPHTMEGAISISSGPVDSLRRLDRVSVEIEQLESLEITSIHDVERPEHAQSADTQ